jgi:drug/metabolite transporter (DMT)-like permease
MAAITPDPIKTRDSLRMGRTYTKLTLTALIWGGTFVAGRIVAVEAGPFSAAFLRFVVASAFLLAFMVKSDEKARLFERSCIIPIITLGLTGVFAYNTFFFLGLKTVAAGRASLIIASNPAFIALFSSIVLRERLGWVGGLGILLSLSGAIAVISHGNPAQLLDGNMGKGELLIFGCVVSWTSYSLIGKMVMRRLSPLEAVTGSCIAGAACLAVPAFAEGLAKDLLHYSLSAWLGIFYLGLFGSAFGFIWYYEGVKTIGPARAGAFINIVPVSSIFLAFLLLNETVDASLGAGAVLVMAGVYLTNHRFVSKKS